jgi:hypothetical protein
MLKHLVAAFVAVGASSAPVLAGPCGPRDAMVEKLTSRYAERLTAGGLQQSRQQASVLEVWASAETGTFTVLMTRPDGTSCIVAAGTDWFEAGPDATPAGTAS